MKSKKLILSCLALVGLIIACNACGLFDNLSLEGVKGYILSFGAFAPLIYMLMFTLVPLTLFPDSILAVAGGLVFGLFWGTLYTIIGAAMGGTLAFYISRSLGRSFVERLARDHSNWLDKSTEKQGFLLVLVLRLIPLIPFDIISYGAGLSKIKYKDYIAATVIGIIPGVMVYTNLGDKALDIHSWPFVCAILILVILFGISWYARKRLNLSRMQDKLGE